MPRACSAANLKAINLTTNSVIKIILSAAVAALLTGFSASAEGYQINSLSAKQIGMGHTGIALKLGAENMFFNPAGMAFSDKTLDISGSITALSSHVTATIDDAKYKTDNGIATPMNLNAAFSIYDNFKAGISFFTPYGSSINWGDNWPGAVLNQNVKLRVFTIQPTFAWAITPKLSIGGGPMITWGSVDLNKALVSASTTDLAINTLKALGKLPAETPGFGQTSPASVNLKGTADIVVGFNVGAMYNATDNLTFGASFRTKMNLKVKKGQAAVRYANQMAQQILGGSLDLIDQANFEAQMPAPWVLGLGVSYKPIKPLTLAFDARLTGWNAYKSLDIEFLAEQLTPYNQHIEKNYKNSWCFSLGAMYEVTRRFDVRAGLMIDTSPVNKEFYNPETPGMTKIEPTCGLSFRPVQSLSIDFGFMYVIGLGSGNTSCSYPDLLGATMIKQLQSAGLPQQAIDKMGFKETGSMKGKYNLHAFSPALGISYSF